MKGFARVVLWLLPLISVAASAQQKERADSLVRLIEAKSGHIQEIDGVSYRKFIGPARFLHNNTYLLCDTALWNVTTNRINAIGHVQIIQENTMLMSDQIEYLVDENLARCRGKVVELFDQDGNILKTRYLDYNTKDSVATFYNGGALKNADGNLIESLNGSYHSKEKLFSFYDNVQMFTDSVFVKSEEAEYRTDLNRAFFGPGTTAWQGENILYADSGDYDRTNDIFVFDLNSYILTPEQEIWSDTLKYFRLTGIADLYNNIQVLDTVQSAVCLGDRGNYQPSPMQVIMTAEPAVAVYTEENGVRDTLFMSSDTLKYYTLRYCDIDTNEIALARERKRLSEVDPLVIEESPRGGGRREQEAENMAGDSLKNIAAISAKDTILFPTDSAAFPVKEAAVSSLKDTAAVGIKKMIPPQLQANPAQNSAPDKKADRKAARKRRDMPRKGQSPEQQNVQVKNFLPDSAVRRENISAEIRDTSAVPEETLLQVTDSSVVISQVPADSLAVNGEVALPPADTTQIIFINAYHHVRFYRSDLQGLCDSLVYTGLDSIARFYKDPVMWNDIKNQFTADSMQAVIKNSALNKVNLISNAFIATREDSVHFNQVKSTEMTAFFRDNDLYRFDALGGASAIFYLEEDSVITIMNQKESKILSASIQERQLQRVKYVEQIKSDAYPVYNLPLADQRLRGFNWREEERPVSRYEVTPRSIRPSQRSGFESIPVPEYPQAEIYFKEKRDSIMLYRSEMDSLRTVRFEARETARLERQRRERARKTDTLALAAGENPAALQGNGTAARNGEAEPARGPDSLAVQTAVAKEGRNAVGKEKKNKKVGGRRSGKTVTVIIEGERVPMTAKEYKAYKKKQKAAAREEKRLAKKQRREEKQRLRELKKKKAGTVPKTSGILRNS